jgi:predicted DNA-binding transcriptional regulator YafY
MSRTLDVKNRADRLDRIERLLFDSPIGLRAVEIAEACGVDRRTIYRDLTMLCENDVPIEQRDGRFYIDRDQYKATTHLTFDEAMALFLAARTASRVQDQQNPHIVTALQKIGHALPRSLDSHLEAVRNVETEITLDLAYRSVLELVTRAWSERHKVSLYADYGRDARPLAKDFAIYMIEPDEAGSLCVVGLDSATQQVRAFRLARIRRAKISSIPYKIPEQFDAERYLAGDWSSLANDPSQIDVVLLFTPEAAQTLMDREWPSGHYRDRIERLADNSVRLTLYVTDWQPLLPWIRSWGAQVEVLEPPLLRQQCALEAARMEARYRPPSRAR